MDLFYICLTVYLPVYLHIISLTLYQLTYSHNMLIAPTELNQPSLRLKYDHRPPHRLPPPPPPVSTTCLGRRPRVR